MDGTGDLRSLMLARAIRLERLTTAWNILEGASAIAAGIASRSVALTAFGLDSAVEVFVSSIATWQLRNERERATRTALRLIAISFIVVGIYVGYEAWLHLRQRTRPDPSPIGLVLTVSAAIIMSVLAVKKGALGRKLDHRVLVAEARFSMVDAGLSTAVLLGLLFNSVLGWWWADPLIAALLAVYSFKEGIEGLRSEGPELG